MVNGYLMPSRLHIYFNKQLQSRFESFISLEFGITYNEIMGSLSSLWYNFGASVMLSIGHHIYKDAS